MIGLRVRSEGVDRSFMIPARNVGRATRAFLTNLAAQAERHAIALASGGNAAPGSYPIPIRSRTFRNAFGFEVDDTRAVVYNEARYSGALHRGFRPYGNPHARPIPPRPYFDDAMNRVDVDRALTVFDAALGAP